MRRNSVHCWTSGLAMLLPLLVSGCQCEQTPSQIASPTLASQVPTAQASTGERSSSPSLPARSAPGSIFVARSQQRIWLATRDALRLRVLEQLAQYANFRLEVGELEPGLLTLRLDGVPLADALSAVLHGTTYSIDYAFDAESRTHVARVVRAGGFGALRAGPGGGAGAQKERRQQPSSTGRPETRAKLEDTAEATWSQSAEVIGETSAEDEWPDDVTDDAQSSTGSVRGPTTGGQRGVGDSTEDLSTAIDALDDPAIQVILDSIEVLEDSNDPSAIPRLRPLLSHPNPAVRERADEAIEWLE
jgi:hypothetical protein